MKRIPLSSKISKSSTKLLVCLTCVTGFGAACNHNSNGGAKPTYEHNHLIDVGDWRLKLPKITTDPGSGGGGTIIIEEPPKVDWIGGGPEPGDKRFRITFFIDANGNGIPDPGEIVGGSSSTPPPDAPPPVNPPPSSTYPLSVTVTPTTPKLSVFIQTQGGGSSGGAQRDIPLN